MKKTTSLFAMLFLVATSCTMTKRTYTKGYHVEWHSIELSGKRHKSQKKQPNPLVEQHEHIHLVDLVSCVHPNNQSDAYTEVIIDDNNEFLEPTENNEPYPIKDMVIVNEVSSASYVLANQNMRLMHSEVEISEDVKQTTKRKKAKNVSNANPAPFDGLGIAGFIIALVGWFVPSPLGLIMCLIGLIFGAISLSRITSNPGEKRGSGFAITAIIMGILGILILLIAAGMG